MDGEDPSNAYTDTSAGDELGMDLDGPSVDFGTVTLPDDPTEGTGEELVFEPDPDTDFLDS